MFNLSRLDWSNFYLYPRITSEFIFEMNSYLVPGKFWDTLMALLVYELLRSVLVMPDLLLVKSLLLGSNL